MTVTASETRQIVADTLHYLGGGWIASDADSQWLTETADAILQPDPGCCQLCQEVRCDDDCPLAVARLAEAWGNNLAAASDRRRGMVVDNGEVVHVDPVGEWKPDDLDPYYRVIHEYVTEIADLTGYAAWAANDVPHDPHLGCSICADNERRAAERARRPAWRKRLLGIRKENP